MDYHYGGAGVRSSAGGGVTFNNCKFQYNQQAKDGAAYFIDRDYVGSVQFNNCLITNNEIVVTLVEVEFMEVVAFGIL